MKQNLLFGVLFLLIKESVQVVVFEDVTENACYPNYNATLRCTTNTTGSFTIRNPCGQPVNLDCIPSAFYPYIDIVCDPDLLGMNITIHGTELARDNGVWTCSLGGNTDTVELGIDFPFLLNEDTVINNDARSAQVTVCAREDTVVSWPDKEDDTERYSVTTSRGSACGGYNQFILTSTITQKEPGDATFMAKVLSTSCSEDDPNYEILESKAETCNCPPIPNEVSLENEVNSLNNEVQTWQGVGISFIIIAIAAIAAAIGGFVMYNKERKANQAYPKGDTFESQPVPGTNEYDNPVAGQGRDPKNTTNNRKLPPIDYESPKRGKRNRSNVQTPPTSASSSGY